MIAKKMMATISSSGQICPGCEITWKSGSSGRTKKRSNRPSRMWYGTSPIEKNSVPLSDDASQKSEYKNTTCCHVQPFMIGKRFIVSQMVAIAEPCSTSVKTSQTKKFARYSANVRKLSRQNWV